jgi:hypothetical protein
VFSRASVSSSKRLISLMICRQFLMILLVPLVRRVLPTFFNLSFLARITGPT